MVGKVVGQFISIEVKGPTTRIQPNQLNWQEMVNRFGGEGLIWREVGEL